MLLWVVLTGNQQGNHLFRGFPFLRETHTGLGKGHHSQGNKGSRGPFFYQMCALIRERLRKAMPVTMVATIVRCHLQK